MTRPTYKEQERHLHEEYIAGRVKPMEAQFCFCGNLLGQRHLGKKNVLTEGSKHWPTVTYTIMELGSMEDALFTPLCRQPRFLSIDHPETDEYELALFNGMVAALEVLKEVHRSWGEDVDGVVEFERRGETTSSFT